jgi:hypothetical protein
MDKNNWILTKQSLPEQYRTLLGANNANELYFVCFFDGENFRDSLHEKIIETEVTHWQYITPLQTK